MASKIGRTTIGRKQRRDPQTCAKRLAFIFAPIILLTCDLVQPASAILNCFTPNMFKMGKVGQPYNYGAERANWYPQQSLQPSYNTGYGQHPMKLLFQPKWKGGSLFGKGWNNWKTGPNSNFYRPSYYGNSGTISHGGYPINEQLNVAPFTIPPSNALTSYSSSNEGWSAPLVSYNQATIPTQQISYESYTVPSPASFQPAKQQINSLGGDSYGIKGGGTSNRYGSTTTKNNNVLLADGGYGSYETQLGSRGVKNQTYGYSYPGWYSGSVDSPAKIAQQLMKFGGFKRQRLQELNKSLPLIHQSGNSARLTSGSNAKFTILDEPRFVGFGTFDLVNNREARLSCSFNEAIDQTNRPLWVKFSGPYNSSQVVNGKIAPPFNCANSQCRTQEIESTQDVRYRFDNGPATSTLIISEPRLSDYGVYRCSALTKVINENPLETIYQIIQF